MNEKHIVARAGLDGLVPLFALLGRTPKALHRAVEEVRAALFEQDG